MSTITKTDNELVAEFMGQPLTLLHDTGYYGTIEHKIDYQMYQSSWNALMPVVQKVRSICVAVEISYSLGTVCKICYNNGKNFEWLSIEDNDGIRAVYKAVVEFIKWYNDQKK